MSLETTAYRLSNKLLYAATSCIDELLTLQDFIKNDYITLTGCEFDSSCILPACTEFSTECNEVYDCSELDVEQDVITTVCEIIVQRS